MKILSWTFHDIAGFIPDNLLNCDTCHISYSIEIIYRTLFKFVINSDYVHLLKLSLNRYPEEHKGCIFSKLNSLINNPLQNLRPFSQKHFHSKISWVSV